MGLLCLSFPATEGAGAGARPSGSGFLLVVSAGMLSSTRIWRGGHEDGAPPPPDPTPFPCRAGDVCAFISNTRLSQAVSGTFPNINTTVDNLGTYLASIPQACPKGPPPLRKGSQ